MHARTSLWRWARSGGITLCHPPANPSWSIRRTCPPRPSSPRLSGVSCSCSAPLRPVAIPRWVAPCASTSIRPLPRCLPRGDRPHRLRGPPPSSSAPRAPPPRALSLSLLRGHPPIHFPLPFPSSPRLPPPPPLCPPGRSQPPAHVPAVPHLGFVTLQASVQRLNVPGTATHGCPLQARVGRARCPLLVCAPQSPRSQLPRPLLQRRHMVPLRSRWWALVTPWWSPNHHQRPSLLPPPL